MGKDVCLHVYITTWIRGRKGRLSDSITIARDFGLLAREKVRGVGIPQSPLPLVSVLAELTQLRVSALSITIVSNAPLGFDTDAFDYLRVGETPVTWDLQEIDPNSLVHPFALSWQYKKMLRADVQSGSDNCVYLYLEHDQLFTQANLDYFLGFTPLLHEYGLAPGFLRVEWSTRRGCFVSTDQPIPTQFTECSKLESNGLLWIDLVNPYYGFSVMTYSRAVAHLDAASYFEEQSRQIVDWGITERAAMCDRFDGIEGLTDADGKPWRSRTPVGFDQQSRRPLGGSQAWHLSNRYAAKKHFVRKRGFGTLPLGDVVTWA